MKINIEISDEQGVALAKQFRIAKYSDGDDLMSQVVDAAYMRTKQQEAISKIATATDIAVVSATLDAMSAAIGIKTPPIKIAP